MQKQKMYPFETNVDVSDLPAHLEYFLVLPFSHQEANNPKNWNTVPTILTFEDQTIRVAELVAQYKEIKGEFYNQYMYFTYRDGYKVNQDLSIISMKKKLARQSLKGLVLFTKVNLAIKNFNPALQNSSIYQDENSMLDYLIGQSQFGNEKILKFIVEVPRNFFFKEVFSIKISGDKKGNELFLHIFSEMKKIFGVNLVEKDIQTLIIKQTGQPVNSDETLVRQRIYNKSKLVLNLRKTIELKRLAAKQFSSNIVIYKLSGKESKTFNYSDISDLTFYQLYTAHLEQQQAKHGKEMSCALKIMDTIIKPDQKLSIASAYFQLVQTNAINLVGLVITQKMVFYHTIPNLAVASDTFCLDNYIHIPPQQEQRRSRLRKISIEKSMQTKNQYFKVRERLQPILIYTSELKYYEDKEKNLLVRIYESLNRFLRDKLLLTLNMQELKTEWKYVYSSTLLTHLKKVDIYKGKAFRGISYDPKVKKGKIITFKQFVSTSVSRSVAISFAADNKNAIKFLFQLEVQEARKIKEFSEMMAEQEVLVQPFSDFEVLEVRKQAQTITNQITKSTKTFQFKIFVLRQLLTEKKLPEIRATFIIWIDNKTEQGHKVYAQIPQTKETTVLVQILSTSELKDWLIKNSFLFANPTANLIFISNMTRQQGNNWNQLAGVEGLKLIRQYDAKITVFFYIGDISKAKQKLQKHNMSQNVILGTDRKQLCIYILKRIKQSQQT